MIYGVSHFTFFIAFILLLILCYLAGKYASRYNKKEGTVSEQGLLVEGTLLSLLIGFTFGMAQNNFQKKRELINEEINTYSTLAENIRLLPDSVYRHCARDLQQILRARINYYKAENDEELAWKNYSTTDSLRSSLSKKILSYAISNSSNLNIQVIVLELNDFSDSLATSELYRKTRVPLAVMKMLLLLSLVVSFVNGYNHGKKKISWVLIGGFAVLLSMTFYMILDLDDSRVGNINLLREISMLEAQSQVLNNISLP